MGTARDPSPRPQAEVDRVAIDRTIRRLGVVDRNRFGRLDARMSPDRLAVPAALAPLALLLRK